MSTEAPLGRPSVRASGGKPSRHVAPFCLALPSGDPTRDREPGMEADTKSLDKAAPVSDRRYLAGMERLIELVQELSFARDLATIQRVVLATARELTESDGAAFVLRDGDHCYYADENAIGPLWKGQRFPMDKCISGWSMRNG